MNCSGRIPLTPVATTVIPSLSEYVNGPPNRSECVPNPTTLPLRQALHESHRRRPASLHFTSATRQKKRSFFYPRDIPIVSTSYPQQKQLKSSGFVAALNLSGEQSRFRARRYRADQRCSRCRLFRTTLSGRPDRRDKRGGRAPPRGATLGSTARER